MNHAEINYSGLDPITINKRLQNVDDLSYSPGPKSNLQSSLQVQQSLVNGIKKDIKTITNPNILENFLKILMQEEVKLSKIRGELSLL